jgi:methionyl-tRNA formyltransferase
LRIVADRTRLAGVVTQPDRKAGRGHKLTPSPVKVAALELGVRTIYEPVAMKPFAQELAGGEYDVFVLASYGRILPQTLLDIPRLGALNVHPSLLPRYRGATPIQTAIRNGDLETGVSIMVMDAGMDTGDLVEQTRVAIDPAETYGELHDRLAVAGAALLGRVLERMAAGEQVGRHAQRGDASVTRPIGKDDLQIDWSSDPHAIVNHVRAYSPQPAARGDIDGEAVKILKAHVDDRGALEIDELVAPNRGRMSGSAYLQSRGTRT